MGDGDEAYSGLLGTFPYAFRNSDSLLLRSYVVLGGVLAALVAFMFGLAFVTMMVTTLGAGGGVFTFSRAFFIVVGLFVVFPLLAPVLLVARRHRRVGNDVRYDAALAAAGYLFVLALYVGLVVSTPESQRETPPGVLAPVVTVLYDLPPLAGLVPPLLAALLVLVLHRRLR